MDSCRSYARTALLHWHTVGLVKSPSHLPLLLGDVRVFRPMIGSHTVEKITGDQMNIMNELMKGDNQRQLG